MRALITGANGFIGSYLTELLVARGCPTAVVVRAQSNTWRISHLLPQVTRIESDLMRIAEARGEIEGFAPDTVFHLAWRGVGNKHRNEPMQVEENLHAGMKLLTTAIACGCKTFVGLGSQAEYGPRNKIMDETEPTEPTTLYGAAKLCAFLLCRQIASTAGIRFAWLRLFSSYGPKDNPEWMIPYLIETLLEGKRPSLTAGEQRWDYIYAADAAEALYAAGASTEARGAFNLGSGSAEALRGIIERIRDLIDPALPLGFGEVPYRPDQVMHLQADVRKLSQATGWRPRTSLEDGLKRTVAWHVMRRQSRERKVPETTHAG